MPHVIEQARSGRAKCRGCGRPIATGEQRFGERLPNPFADDGGETTHWFHLRCAAFLRPGPFLETLAATPVALEGREQLEQEARLGVAHRRLPRVTAVGRAPSGRAACRACREPIGKGIWRIALVYHEDGRFAPGGFIHVGCAAAYLETSDVLDRLRHFSPALAAADVDEIRGLLAGTGS